MYRVGFGDCFLISLPVAEGDAALCTHRHILVDCGVHSRGDIGTIQRVVENIARVTERTLAVVIATHAHQDHIAGYDRFGALFSTFRINEVWLPWTWDPGNKDALKLQKKRTALTAQLVQHFDALARAGSENLNAHAAHAIDNSKGNAHAISLLKAGFGVGARVRYLKAGDNLTNPAAIDGLSVRILGPPQSTEFLARMDPPSGDQYLRIGPDDRIEPANAIQPFPERWRRTEEKDPCHDHTWLSAADEKQLRELAVAPLDSLAFALDQALNNESVVALLTYRGQYLLLPGDAQYGNWKWWLDNEQPEVILPEVSFFKVAHHGSLNATPRSALEKMCKGKFAAMVSTQSTPWPSIPRGPLMARLHEQTHQRLVRSDWLAVSGAPEPPPGTVPEMPAELPKGFSQGELWFDYLLPV